MKKITFSLFLLLFFILLRSQNHNVVLRSNLKYNGQRLANVWGHVDSTGKEYALVGASKGMSVVNVSNPGNPVEVTQIPGPDNGWREIRTFRKHAFITTEGGGGLQIVNLGKLPSTNLPSKYWAPVINGDTLNTIHALHVDTAKKFLYLYGSNIQGGGALAVDISDPWNPVYKGIHSNGTGNLRYIHDGIVRNDTLYGSHIYAGYFDVVDFRNKSNPVVLATHNTPGNFTHNTWLSGNSKVLFTTDEVSHSFLTAYDISNLNNITELDRIQSNPGSGSIVHNTYIKDEWAVTSWYKDGFTIVDAHRPENLVQVGNYDTHTGSGSGFSGAWGVYPYLPSGSILVSNIGEGLFIFTPDYVRACYLEGNVSDSICGGPLGGVTVTILLAGVTEQTAITGDYKTGYHTPGMYTVTFSKAGYQTLTKNNVSLTAGNIKTLHVKLYSDSLVALSGTTKDTSSAPLPGVKIRLENSKNSYNYTSDGSGNFSQCNVVAGTYDLYAGKWGYETKCISNQSLLQPGSSLSYTLAAKIYDDFTLDLGWTSVSAAQGKWARGVPMGTYYSPSFSATPVPANPGSDISGDCSDRAYVTGINGMNSSDDDVDGTSILTSPVFDLTGFSNPMIRYYRWFANTGGQSLPNDSLIVSLSNGAVTVPVEIVTSSDTSKLSKWIQTIIRVKDYITPASNMKIIFYVSDALPGHITEAGVDKFEVYEGVVGIDEKDKALFSITSYPNPFSHETRIDYRINGAVHENSRLCVYDILGKEIIAVKINGGQGSFSLTRNLEEGVYFIRIENGTGSSRTVKVIKTK